jgi:hypothetical protein
VVKTLFFSATCRMCQMSSRSDLGLPKSSGSACRSEAGTVSSISASSEETPITSNISAISAGEGPMWRRFAKS